MAIKTRHHNSLLAGNPPLASFAELFKFLSAAAPGPDNEDVALRKHGCLQSPPDSITDPRRQALHMKSRHDLLSASTVSQILSHEES